MGPRTRRIRAEVILRACQSYDTLQCQGNLTLEESKAWLGDGWIDTVTVESRGKITDMLAEAAAQGVSGRRQVNHVSPSGADIPIVYTAVRMDETPGKVVAIGRDLRAVSALPQRLVEAQQSLERDYWRMRHSETRYRLLFQVYPEGHRGKSRRGATVRRPRSPRRSAAISARRSLKNLAALETTDDNRTSAAEVLGVSRQRLYLKLKRYGPGSDAEAPIDGANTKGRKNTPG
jgi:hypothetical protein